MELKRLIPATAFALSVVVSGCGDATGGNTVSLTLDEASEISVAIIEAVGSGISGVHTASSAVNETVSCDGGGTALVAGTSDGGAVNNVTVTFSACHTTHFVMAGSVTFVETETASATAITMKGDLTITGSKSGNCHIDLTPTAGSICGVNRVS